MILFHEVPVQEPASIICDRCGRRAENVPNDFEFGEYLSIEHICGYASIFGDETRMSARYMHKKEVRHYEEVNPDV